MIIERQRRDVVVAVIVRDGRLLLAQRDPKRSDYAWLWECPGGKVEDGETLRDALARALSEELGVQAEIGDPLQSFDFDPPMISTPTRVTFFQARIPVDAVPRPLVAVGIGWFNRGAVRTLDMMPANAAFRVDLAMMVNP